MDNSRKSSHTAHLLASSGAIRYQPGARQWIGFVEHCFARGFSRRIRIAIGAPLCCVDEFLEYSQFRL